jgi:polynucleotide 5'-hydroxyl-kinase GRC3/NOL9
MTITILHNHSISSQLYPWLYLVKGPAVMTLSGQGSVLGKDVSNTSVSLRAGKILPFEIDRDCKINVELKELGQVWLTHRSWAGTSIWHKITKTILTTNAKKVLIIGDNDSGKSTLATYIINLALESKCRVAIIDADIGQGDLAPPNAIGAAVVTKQIVDLRDVTTELFEFVGNTSPVGFENMVIRSVKRCIKKMSNLYDLCIINTDGYIENSGIYYKARLAQEVLPDFVVCLGEKCVLDKFKSINCNSILTLHATSPRTVEKSRTERLARRLDQYFRFVPTKRANSKVINIGYGKIKVVYKGITYSKILKDSSGYLECGGRKTKLRIDPRRLVGMYVGLGRDENITGFGIVISASSDRISIQSGIISFENIYLSNSGISFDGFSEFRIM